jgi:hypothetical protein
MTILQDHVPAVHVEDDDHEPSESDRSWWASQNTDWHDQGDDDDEDIERRAAESAYLDHHEAGLSMF